jgi:hypothetical protein
MPASGVATGRVRLWAKRWDWASRAAAWDAHLDAAGRRTAFEKAQEMAERHAAISCALQARVAARLQSMSDEEVNRLTAYELILWFNVATRVERIARGVPEKVTKRQHTATQEPPAVVEVQEMVVRSRADIDEVRRLAAETGIPLLNGGRG